MNTRTAVTARNSMLDALGPLLNNGYIRIYDGSQPATPETAISGQTLLAELRFNATAFAAASNGTMAANAITSDSSANATGTATWARCLKSDGTTAIYDGDVGATGAGKNFELNSASIVSGAVVALTALNTAAPMQGA